MYVALLPISEKNFQCNIICDILRRKYQYHDTDTTDKNVFLQSDNVRLTNTTVYI